MRILKWMQDFHASRKEDEGLRAGLITSRNLETCIPVAHGPSLVGPLGLPHIRAPGAQPVSGTEQGPQRRRLDKQAPLSTLRPSCARLPP